MPIQTLRFSLVFSAAVGLAVIGGCGTPPPEPSREPSPADPAAAPFREVWEAHSLQGSKVGFGRTAYFRDVLEGRPVVRIVSESQLAVLRFGQKFEQQYRDVGWETDDGELLKFESELNLGDAPLKTVGVVRGDVADVTQQTGDGMTTQQIPWTPGAGGATAPIESLRRKPLGPGEVRTLTSFLPAFNQVAAIRLAARSRETVDVDGASRSLLRIDAEAAVDGKKVYDFQAWADDQGEVWKVTLPMIEQTIVRTTEAAAKAPSTMPRLDLAQTTLIRLEQPIAQAHAARRLRYRVRLKDGDAATVFPVSEGQAVQAFADGSVELTVSRVEADSPLPAGYVPAPPTEADRRANSIVQSDDAEVRRLADLATGSETDPAKIAVRQEAYVREKMNAAVPGAGFDFSKAFASAAETARTLRGDCTEHAVLLAAMLRARGIPSRTVIGLVYVEGSQSLGYHLWTEAYVGDRWMPLDATVGRGGTSAAYLKLANANLDGAAMLTSFLPLLNVVGRLQIEVVDRE